MFGVNLFARVIVSFVIATLSQKVLARAPEPAKMDPVKDAAYISALGISTQNWNDPIINILIVGQDGKTTFHKGSKYARPNGEKVEDLSSHADGNMLLSFNKKNGIVSIISVYRGFLVPEEYWTSLDEAPPAMSGGMSTRYLANYYLYAGRVKYMEFTKQSLESFIRLRKIESQYFINGEFRIHGVVETGFDGFKSAMSQFIEYFGSSAKVMWALKGHTGTLIEIFRDRDNLLRELRSQEGFQVMTEKRKTEVGADPARAILGTLRERQKYEAGGYQRSFNHAKFISYVLGLVGYTMAEAEFVDFLKEPAIVNTFNVFSRTFDLRTFDANLRLPDRNLHAIARTGFSGGESPMHIIQVGTSINSYAAYNRGKFVNKGGEGYIEHLNPTVQLIPKPNDCPACSPR